MMKWWIFRTTVGLTVGYMIVVLDGPVWAAWGFGTIVAILAGMGEGRSGGAGA